MKFRVTPMREVAGTEVARLTGYSPIQVSRIRRRFAEEGFAGLMDRPRAGRPPRLTEAKGARIVALTLQSPPKGLTHWSTREIAQRVGVSHTTVHRIWQAHALQPHRVETFKFSTDAQAEAKIRDVVGLYLNPPTNAVVLSVDEKTQIQALVTGGRSRVPCVTLEIFSGTSDNCPPAVLERD